MAISFRWIILFAGCRLAFGQFHLPGAAVAPDKPPVTKRPAAKSSSPASEPASVPSSEKAPPVEYYELILGWAPNFCAMPGYAADHPKECAPGRGIRFIVHGLRPVTAHEDPACGPRPISRGPILLALPVMPDEKSIRQEWEREGACSSLSAAEYVSAMREARAKVQVPVEMSSIDESTVRIGKEILAQFAGANPGIAAGAFRAACSSGELREVRIAFDLQINPIAFPLDKSECTDSFVSIRPPL